MVELLKFKIIGYDNIKYGFIWFPTMSYLAQSYFIAGWGTHESRHTCGCLKKCLSHSAFAFGMPLVPSDKLNFSKQILIGGKGDIFLAFKQADWHSCWMVIILFENFVLGLSPTPGFTCSAGVSWLLGIWGAPLLYSYIHIQLYTEHNQA